MTRLGGAKRSLASQRWQTAVACPYQPNLPTDALIDLKVRRRLGRFIPVWGWVKGLAVLRITVIPKRRPACRVMRGGFVSGQVS